MDKLNFFFSMCLSFAFFKSSQQQVYNVALNKPAYQHTDVYYERFFWTADKAVDNCLLRDQPDYQQCCSSTQVPRGKHEEENYWRLNLTRPYEVVKIEIYAREDERVENQLYGFELYTVEYLGGPEVLEYNDTYHEPPDQIYRLLLPTARNITEIVIRRPVLDLITLCEVQIYAVCDDGYFGEGCRTECGHCLDDAICNKTSGHCPSGCKAGFYGDKCDCGNCLDGKPCIETTAPCMGDGPCTAKTATCPHGCAAGWGGDNCFQACSDGTYGENCNQTCGHCLNDTDCNIFDGSCSHGCQAGWQGDKCLQECEPGTYGHNCNVTCGNCLDGEQCNNVTGRCSNGCDPGWRGDMCATKCFNNTYGPSCFLACGNCFNGGQCNNVNGSCPSGCGPGWMGERCITACRCETYGQNCNSRCGHCKDAHPCNHITGECPDGCAEGYTGSTCHVAGAGTGKNIGAIVGGVLGGLAFLCVVGICLYLLYKRRLKAGSPSDMLPITEISVSRSSKAGQDISNKGFDGQY